MSKLKFALLAGVASTSFALSANALAYQAGDILVRFGAATVEPKESSDPVLAEGNGVGLNSNTTAGISGTYFLDKNLAIEVLGALPFNHDIYGTGGLKGLGKIGSTKHLPPTVSLQFYPKVSESFHPYFGIGLNYTIFFGEDTTDSLTNGLGANETDLKLDNSLGLAFQLGCDYQLNKNWAINAAVWKIDIDTTAHVDVNGEEATKFDVAIDPYAYMVGAAYKF